jgi:hypothetical protein
LNHRKTSVSTRSEIGCFAEGSTTVASSQKSSGRSANSGGDVALISRSETRRSRARSARPRTASLLRVGRLVVRFAFTVIALPGRNDSSIDFAVGLGPIRVDDGQRDTLSLAQGDDSALPVIAARICPLQPGPIEDLRGEFKVESALPEISSALPSIPAKARSGKYTSVYTIRQVHFPGQRPADRLITGRFTWLAGMTANRPDLKRARGSALARV